jgi:ATP-dependent helicase YprA (DUF1998 family)
MNQIERYSMNEKKEFNPIHAARTIENSYREYIATTIHFANPKLQNQLEEILRQPRFLAKGPYLEAAPPYKTASSVRQLVDEGILCKSMLSLGGGDTSLFNPDLPLYVHQERAIRKAINGRNYAVVTGTGSGKTESFLLPIFNDILSEFETEGYSPGVRALILYPMNALANDQLKRLRSLLKGTQITFGRYIGDTETSKKNAENNWKSENPGQKRLENELISREEMRETPPNILLTNYSMLEYLLLRPEDAPLFSKSFGKKWRHLAIDEVHTYSGALGTEIAYLIRRLKARIEKESGERPNIHCYATSATIGTENDLPKVAKFCQGLFGETFSSSLDDIDVITSEKDSPVDHLSETSWGAIPLDRWEELRSCLLNHNAEEPMLREKLALFLSPLVPKEQMKIFRESHSALLGLGEVLLGESSTCALVRRMSDGLLDLTDPENIDELGIPGLGESDNSVETLTAMVEVLSTAQRSENVPVLTSRYHSFLRAPEGIFINLRDMRLISSKANSEISIEGFEIPVYEISVCRHCGQAYILGKYSSFARGKGAWLNPKHDGTYADDDFIPREYFRLIPDGETEDLEETTQWICPICGSLHDSKNGGMHRFDHGDCPKIRIGFSDSEDKQATELEARCRHCGYSSPIAIQPMRVSPEAAGSIVCYDLVREIPPFEKPAKEWYEENAEEEIRGGNVICFADNRQDAAFFAPAMDRTYSSITKRQLIRESIFARSSDNKGCSPTEAISWISDVGSKRYPHMFADRNTGQFEETKDVPYAWVLDELSAEDSRNSLEGLGLIKIEPTSFNESFENANVKKEITRRVDILRNGNLSWLNVDDYVLFLEIALETLRERNAVDCPPGVGAFRSNNKKQSNYVVEENGSSKKGFINFVGSSSSSVRENKRSSFIRKYALEIYNVNVSRSDVRPLLQSMFEFLGQYLGGYFKKKNYLIGAKNEFTLNKDIWRLYPMQEDDTIYRCDVCGCESNLDTRGVCTTTNCPGHLEKMTVADAKSKDRYYKQVYHEAAIPIIIEEHTAQLTSERARKVQSDFINGDVNVLSCTTTFELGVDVGDLRSIYMMNVPPTNANYTQRSGRVGRRASKPGYAITFCRLRPHDITFFRNPEKMISGTTRVPTCYLENTEIATRHVNAIAFSEYFRNFSDDSDDNYSYKTYDKLFDLSQENPEGIKKFKEYLDSHPDEIYRQLSSIFQSDSTVAEELGIYTWEWIPRLVDPDNEKDSGRLLRVHSLKHDDYERVIDAIQRTEDSGVKARLYKSKEALEKEQTVAVLAENGVLPKYGFPTDIVELHLPEMSGVSKERGLKLQRGMRQAIREYAPGSEVVAGGKLWKSSGIKQLKGRELIRRKYGQCQECKNFVWPIDDLSDSCKCPVCESEVSLDKRMLIPSFGFIGIEVKRGIGLRKPRFHGYTNTFFSQHWPDETEEDYAIFEGGSVSYRFASNGQLCVVNNNFNCGFFICNSCGGAATKWENIHHSSWCKKNIHTPTYTHEDALGSAFTSDVLELIIKHNVPQYASDIEWESLMWALFATAAEMLEIPQNELGGTMYHNSNDTISLMIYDNVPGGAGHARQLYNSVEDLLNQSYERVSTCTCSEDTCCYGCIGNYYNQSKQSELSRGAAMRILGSLLHPTGHPVN